MRRCLVCRGIAWCAGAGGGTLKRKMQIMRRVMGVVVLMALAASGASAQGIPSAGARPGNEIGTGSSLPLSDRASNIGPGDTRSSIAPNLPAPPLGEDAPVQAYLQAARSALIAGRTGEAQQALEMAARAHLIGRCCCSRPAPPAGTRWWTRSGRRVRHWALVIVGARCRSSMKLWGIRGNERVKNAPLDLVPLIYSHTRVRASVACTCAPSSF